MALNSEALLSWIALKTTYFHLNVSSFLSVTLNPPLLFTFPTYFPAESRPETRPKSRSKSGPESRPFSAG